MSKLFLLDAYALIYRAYYAFIKNPRVTSKGQNTSAIFGFVNTLEDLLKKENPTHIGVAFDPSGPTFRHEAFEQYKAQREETPEGIRTAVPYIKEIIKAYRIPILEVAGFEADDVIGTLATIAGKEGHTVFMMTPDKDYGQLVTENVKMFRPKYGDKEFEILGPQEICEKFSIQSPGQVIDLLGLMGDASDNIPGCPGVGEKTAQKLIAEFGSIDNLLNNTHKLKGALQKKVSENREAIEFSRFLATIKIDVPIDLDMHSLERESIDGQRLREIFEELEFRQLADRILSASKPKQTDSVQGFFFGEFPTEEPAEPKYSNLSELSSDVHRYHLVDTQDKRDELLKKISGVKNFCFDTETTGIDPISAELVGMSFCWKDNEAYYVPVPADQVATQAIVNEFKNVFENPDTIKVGQNIKYDLLVLQNYGIEVKGNLFDTMIAHYLLQPELRHGMDYLAEVYLSYKTIHIDELIGTGKKQISMRDVPVDKVCQYAAEDADVTWKLKNILEKELKENQLESLFYDIEMPLVRVLATMERNGVLLDTDSLKQSSLLLTERLATIEKDIFSSVGKEFNISSPKQVGEVLFEDLKVVEKAKKTKTGQYSTSEEVLEGLRHTHPVVEMILEYRGVKKLLNTYIDALPQLINPKTGHIHTSFNQTVTATGRLSSSNPNLQNIPIRDEEGKEIRKAFIPEEGCSFFSADYSQIELRIMAHLSGDQNMIEAFCKGEDIHAATAAKIYQIPLSEVTKDMRRKAKTANFGIIYGISVFGLADRLNIDRKEAKELIDGYFRTFPGVKAYMEQSIQVAREKGFVETIFNRKRYLADINSKNAIVRGYAERNAINAPIQGSAADIIKVAMVRIHERFQQEAICSKMILQVHDELNFSVLAEEKNQVERIVLEEMESATLMRVPLHADSGSGANWLEAH